MSLQSVSKASNAIFGKVYELSLVKGYVARWGLSQAVRELIQNSLDSSSPFVYEFELGTDGLWTLKLNSEFTTLTPQTLLLGSTSKADSQDSIGSFGEGYKIALLVLTREGFDVEIHNGDLLWRPRFRFSRTFGEEILIIEETVAADRANKGLTFVVRGLDESNVNEIKDSCLRMQDNVGAIKSTQYGDILLDRPGKLYVGSLYVCETELKYGYNIKPQYMRLERDRQTVSTWDLQEISLKCWYDTGETERIAKMISEEVPDVEYSQYNAPEIIKDACYKIFKEAHPGAIIASSPEDLASKIKQGLVKTVYVGGVMHSIVSRSIGYMSEVTVLRKPYIAPHICLAAYLSAHRDEMRRPAIVAFKALIKEAEERWIVRP